MITNDFSCLISLFAKKTIKGLYTNTDNSLSSKLDELKVLLTSDPQDLIGLVEIKPKFVKYPKAKPSVAIHPEYYFH